jgi:hypothetical protein
MLYMLIQHSKITKMSHNLDFEGDFNDAASTITNDSLAIAVNGIDLQPPIEQLQGQVFSIGNPEFTEDIQKLATKWMVRSENKIVAFRLLIDTWRPFFPTKESVINHKPMIEQLVINGLSTQDKMLLYEKVADGRLAGIRQDPETLARRDNRNAIKRRVNNAVYRITSALIDHTNAEMKKRGHYLYKASDYAMQDESDDESNKVTKKKSSLISSEASVSSSSADDALSALTPAGMTTISASMTPAETTAITNTIQRAMATGDANLVQATVAKVVNEQANKVAKAINPNGPAMQLFNTPIKLMDIVITHAHKKGYMNSSMAVWEPCNGNGNITNALRAFGYSVRYSDIVPSYSEPELGPIDFTKIKLMPDNIACDIIITNPPFTGYENFIKTCKLLGKPFIMILPINKIVQKVFMRVMKNVRYSIVITYPKMLFTYVDKEGVTRESQNDIVVIFANFPHNTDVIDLCFVDEDVEN